VTLVLEELARIVVQFYGLQPISEWQEAFGTIPFFLETDQSLGLLSVRGLALFEIALGTLTVATIWAFLTKTRYGHVQSVDQALATTGARERGRLQWSS
jgi:branched-chain amino acid transport system permease protein